jgi:small subunit ribosomal protein S28e
MVKPKSGSGRGRSGPGRGGPGRGGPGRGRRPRKREIRVELKEEEKMEMYREAAPAKVIEWVDRTGVRGEVIQVRCKVLAGRDAGKVLRRNVKGPIKIGDIIMVRDTEMEAAPLTRGRK